MEVLVLSMVILTEQYRGYIVIGARVSYVIRFYVGIIQYPFLQNLIQSNNYRMFSQPGIIYR